VQLTVQKAEEKSRIFKRSIYVVEDIKDGEIFTKRNIRVIRPGDGLAPKYYDEILGKKARADYKKGTPMKMYFIK
jgi:sialic acid synthase SpsE